MWTDLPKSLRDKNPLHSEICMLGIRVRSKRKLNIEVFH